MRTGPKQEREWSALMRSAQEGDKEAYTQLLGEIAPLLRAAALHKRFAPDLAEDVMQDTLLSLHAARQTYDPSRDFLPWMMAIFRHRLQDRLRADYRRGANEISFDPTGETFLSFPANEDGRASENSREVAKALAQLSDKQRRALELMKLQGLSLKEAAEKTGSSIPALKVTVHRAMERLKKLLVPRNDVSSRPFGGGQASGSERPARDMNKDNGHADG